MLLMGFKSCLVKVCFGCHLKEWSVRDERSEPGREFQILGAAAWNERDAKMRLVRGTCKRLEEEDDLT